MTNKNKESFENPTQLKMPADKPSAPAAASAANKDIVKLERKGHIAVFTLNRPDAMNAISYELATRFGELLEEFEADDSLWVSPKRRGIFAREGLTFRNRLESSPRRTQRYFARALTSRASTKVFQ